MVVAAKVVALAAPPCSYSCPLHPLGLCPFPPVSKKGQPPCPREACATATSHTCATFTLCLDASSVVSYVNLFALLSLETTAVYSFTRRHDHYPHRHNGLRICQASCYEAGPHRGQPVQRSHPDRGTFSSRACQTLLLGSAPGATADPACLQNLQQNCFEKCVAKPGSSLSSSEKSCATSCMEKYMAAWNQVNTAYINRIRKEQGQ